MIAGWGCETGCIGIPMIGTGDLLHPNQKQPIGPVNHHGKSHMKIMKTEFSSYMFWYLNLQVQKVQPYTIYI